MSNNGGKSEWRMEVVVRGYIFQRRNGRSTLFVVPAVSSGMRRFPDPINSGMVLKHQSILAVDDMARARTNGATEFKRGCPHLPLDESLVNMEFYATLYFWEDPKGVHPRRWMVSKARCEVCQTKFENEYPDKPTTLNGPPVLRTGNNTPNKDLAR